MNSKGKSRKRAAADKTKPVKKSSDDNPSLEQSPTKPDIENEPPNNELPRIEATNEITGAVASESKKPKNTRAKRGAANQKSEQNAPAEVEEQSAPVKVPKAKAKPKAKKSSVVASEPEKPVKRGKKPNKKQEPLDNASPDIEAESASSNAPEEAPSKAKSNNPKITRTRGRKIADKQEEVPPNDDSKEKKPDTNKGKKAPKAASEPAEASGSKTTVSTEEAKASKPPNRSILQLKVTLMHIAPPIYRRIQVLNNNTFADLRESINEAMGWISNRSHQFIALDLKKDANVLIVDGNMKDVVYDFSKDEGRLFKEQTTKLSNFLNAKGDKVMYEFDLGDSWLHEVIVEKVLPPPPPKAEYPKCTGGKRACPPEDCGGVDGYNHLVEVYQDRNHEEYEELIEGWLADLYPGWNPEVFDFRKVFKKVGMWVQM